MSGTPRTRESAVSRVRRIVFGVVGGCAGCACGGASPLRTREFGRPLERLRLLYRPTVVVPGGPACSGKARETVVRQCVPGCTRADVGVVLRADPGIAVEHPEAYGRLVAAGPAVAEETRAADGAERLHGAAVPRIPHADQVLAREDADAAARHPRVRQPEGAG